MLKTILNRLNGHAVEAPSLAEALAELTRDRQAVKGELDALNQRRRQLLLDDADDKVLDRVEREIDRATIKLEKLTVAEQPLQEQLEYATAAERRKRWESHVTSHRKAAAEFLTAARAVLEKHAGLVGIVEQAHREGFAGEIASSMPPTPNIGGNPLCAPDLLDQFERAFTPAAPIRVRPTPVVRAPSPAPTLQHAVAVSQGTGREVTASIGPMTAARLDDDDGPLQAGEARVVVIRSGYSADGVALSHAGRKVCLPREIAMAAARAGAVEIIQE